MRSTPDRIDEHILAILQVDNQLTYAEVAERVSMSASSCRRRIKALRKAGVIVADVSVVNPKLAGNRFTVIALVTLERDTPASHDAFRKGMRTLPEVEQCYFVAGAYDYVVQFRLSAMEEYDPIVDRHFIVNPDVKRVESMFVFTEVKSLLSNLPESATGRE